ncbi:MAG: Trm112 family protein [Desulfovibrionaceae bacterium]|nr:Trm112 family protein [Desulfovibrionaceae bacterium]MBO4793627.1 Trm112 family protein [Deltaproteobacteria bacterium]
MNKSLLELLVCPVCRGPVHPEDEDSRLVCPACRVAYPVREDIPVMLPEEAKPWEPKEHQAQ